MGVAWQVPRALVALREPGVAVDGAGHLAVLGGPAEDARLVRRAVAVLGRDVPHVLAWPPPGYPGPP